jgi:hypothetical protein
MIYCNAADCDFMIDAFRCLNFYNADGDEVTTILPADPITIRAQVPEESVTVIVEKVEGGWVYPTGHRFRLEESEK